MSKTIIKMNMAKRNRTPITIRDIVFNYKPVKNDDAIHFSSRGYLEILTKEVQFVEHVEKLGLHEFTHVGSLLNDKTLFRVYQYFAPNNEICLEVYGFYNTKFHSVLKVFYVHEEVKDGHSS